MQWWKATVVFQKFVVSCNRSRLERYYNMRLIFAKIASAIGITMLLLPAARAQLDATGTPHLKWLIGPEAGYNWVNYQTNPIPILNSEPAAFLVQNGSGHNIFWGASSELPLVRDMRHFLVVEVGYESMSGTFSTANSEPFSRQEVLYNLNGTYDTVNVTYTAAGLKAELSYLFLNIGYKYNFRSDTVPNGFGIQFLFEVGLKMAAVFSRSVSSSLRSNDVAATAITDAQALRLALRPELTYDWPLNDHWILTPFAGFDYPLTKVDAPENWTATSIFAGVSLRDAIW